MWHTKPSVGFFFCSDPWHCYACDTTPLKTVQEKWFNLQGSSSKAPSESCNEADKNDSYVSGKNQNDLKSRIKRIREEKTSICNLNAGAGEKSLNTDIEALATYAIKDVEKPNCVSESVSMQPDSCRPDDLQLQSSPATSSEPQDSDPGPPAVASGNTQSDSSHAPESSQTIASHPEIPKPDAPLLPEKSSMDNNQAETSQTENFRTATSDSCQNAASGLEVPKCDALSPEASQRDITHSETSNAETLEAENSQPAKTKYQTVSGKLSRVQGEMEEADEQLKAAKQKIDHIAENTDPINVCPSV